MKKTFLNSLAVLVLAGLMVFQSCSTTEVSEPIVVVSSVSDGWDGATNTFTGEVGDTLELSISVTADGIFNTLRITKDGSTLLEESRTEEGQTSYTTTYKYGLMSDEVGDSIVLTIAGIDDEAKSTEETVSIKTIAKAIPVVSYTARLMYAPTGDLMSKTFFSSDNGDTYSRDDVESTTESVSPLIDFGYYFGNTAKATIVSPASYPSAIYDLSSWGTVNDTKLKLTEMPVDHFTSIADNDDIMEHWAMTDMSDADGDVIDLAVDNLVAFELDAAKGSKKGFFLVKAITGTFNSGDYIEIDVVIEGEE